MLRTRNFTLAEVIHSDYNSFPKDLLPIAYMALERAQSLRDIIGEPLIITSGYRSQGFNATLPNSAPNSRHIWRYEGDRPVFALDIKCPTISSKELVKLIARYVYGEVYENVGMKFVHLSPQWDKDETFKI